MANAMQPMWTWLGHVLRSARCLWVALQGEAAGAQRKSQGIAGDAGETRRQALARGHTLGHLLIAALRRVVEDFEGEALDVDETGTCVRVIFRTTSSIDDLALDMIDRLVKDFIARDAAISGLTLSSPDDGARIFPKWRADRSAGSAGPVQVIDIAGIYASPSSGPHVASTRQVGPYLLSRDVLKRGSTHAITAERT